MKQSDHKGVGDHHLAADPSQNGRTDINDDREFIHQHGQQVAGEDHEGDAQGQTEEQQEEVALGGPGHGQDIVGGHGEIGDDDDPDGLQEGFGFSFYLFVRGPFHEEFDGNPDYDGPADKFNKVDLQQLGGKKSQGHPKEDRRAGPESDAPGPLLARQRAHRHGDDHGIVPGQNEIDEHNAQQTGYKFPVKVNLPEDA